MKLDLGVWNIAYSDPDIKNATTTEQVAEILEKKYGVMQTFFDTYKEEIGEQVVDGLIDILESRLQGAPAVALNDIPLPKIEKMFSNYLSRDEWQKITGQVIMAAKLGISHRKKGKKRKGPREAFVDSGTYQKSFAAWFAK